MIFVEICAFVLDCILGCNAKFPLQSSILIIIFVIMVESGFRLHVGKTCLLPLNPTTQVGIVIQLPPSYLDVYY